MDANNMYCKGTRVWIPDPESVWICGELLEDIKDNLMILALEDGREVELDLTAVGGKLPPLRNPDILTGVNDLTTLSYLHEPAVLFNLRERFLNFQAIYTYCGIVLVALNPYEEVPLYGPDMIAAYSGHALGEMDPHIFAIAEDAFKQMVSMGRNQSIIVSGESGAGKTVSAKYAMRYFANVGGSMTETMIEKKVLSSNPIMEAIGNATTIRNDNSSRFGKFIEINFSEKHQIVGANMRTYLLEKSRVVFQAQDERNYHIFYQLCQSRHRPELQELNLGPPEQFFYTSQGEKPSVDGMDDAKNFSETCEAMSMLGIYGDIQRMIWRILAAVLHLGNVSIMPTSKSGDECYVKNDDFGLLMVSSLLGVDQAQLCKWLCARKIVATGEVYIKPLTLSEANVGRDALAKHVYAQLFKWVVEHINVSLATTAQSRSFIGVLDIYGFETFEVNSFEQFCINYANEKLQQQFNRHVFKLEQEEYIREGINWSFIDYYDNQPCIDLIENKLGILDLLDEECRMPKGSDTSWAQKLYKQHVSKSRHFVKPRMSEAAFIIRHYADDVIYDCRGFVEKNRDSINEEHLSLLRASEYELVGDLFQTDDPSGMFVPRKRASSRVGKHAPKGKKTVGSEFRDSLQKLMDTLDSTEPHYIRCIKSNDNKAAFQFDPQRCVQQLRACGVLETIRISASGYPSRWTYEEFFDRYRLLIKWKEIDWNSLKETCNLILSRYINDEDKFQLGKKKIFFRAGQVAYLEKLRADRLKASCIMIQKHVRGWLRVRCYQRMRKAAILIQAWARGHQARRLARFLRETLSAIIVQTCWRGHRQRKRYRRIRNSVVLFQAQARGVLARRRFMAVLHERASIKIQKVWRGFRERKAYRKKMWAIVYLQCCVRRMYARRERKRLRIEARSVEHLKKTSIGLEKKIMTLQEKLTEEIKEKQLVQQRLDEYLSHEGELLKLRELRPLYEDLVRQVSLHLKESEGLRKEILFIQKEKSKLAEDKESLRQEKDQEISSLKSSLELLRQSLHEQKKRSDENAIKEEETLQKRLCEQKEQLMGEFHAERANHQKMLGEYARLEQRYANLVEEMKLEKSGVDKRRALESASFAEDSLMVFPDEDKDGKISSLTSELYEIRRERDMLLEQVELLKEEQTVHEHVQVVTMATVDENENVAAVKDDLQKENDRLTKENQRLRDQLERISRPSLDGDDDKAGEHDKTMMAELLRQIKELRDENKKLRKRLEELESRDVVKGIFAKVPLANHNGDLIDSAEKEWSRLTVENIKLKEEVEHLMAELKDVQENAFISSPRRRSSVRLLERTSSSGRSQDESLEANRKRSRTMDTSKLVEGNMSEAGKLVMTYAGLMKKRNESGGQVEEVQSPSVKKSQRLGMLKFEASACDGVIDLLVTSLTPVAVASELPGLPAHLLFMALRYIDHVNDERLMQSFLTASFSGIKKNVKNHPGDLDLISFWLANACRFLNDMKQYSGEEAYQATNTREQNQHCLKNFDLSEYRQVLGDACVNMYQDLVGIVQKRISELIVPGMMEYESIPGVVSTLKKFKSERKAIEEIITVKDILNKLSAILAVLNAHCTDPGLIKQIFRQIYYFINATMVNSILLRKDMCHWSRGLQIKFNLSQIEDWIRTHQLSDNSGIIEELQPITSVVQLLQINKKSMEDVDNIIATCAKLNSLQVQKILSMYTPQNEYEPRIPAAVIRAVAERMKKADDGPTYIMMDLSFVFPMMVPYSPSTVRFDRLAIPSKLASAVCHLI